MCIAALEGLACWLRHARAVSHAVLVPRAAGLHRWLAGCPACTSHPSTLPPAHPYDVRPCSFSAAAVPRAAPETKRKGCWLDSLSTKQRNASKRRPGAQPPAAGSNDAASAGAADAVGGGAGAAGGGDAAGAAGKAGEVLGPGSHIVLYQFLEGYTNAVKRPLRLQDML